MGGAIALALAADGDASHLLLIDPAPGRALAESLSARGARFAADAAGLTSVSPTAILLAVKPQLMAQVAPGRPVRCLLHGALQVGEDEGGANCERGEDTRARRIERYTDRLGGACRLFVRQEEVIPDEGGNQRSAAVINGHQRSSDGNPMAIKKPYPSCARRVACAAASGAILPLFSLVFGAALNILNDDRAAIVASVSRLASRRPPSRIHLPAPPPANAPSEHPGAGLAFRWVGGLPTVA
jgi:hypothetical protein